MLNILITGVGGPTPRSFAIALKKYGHYKDYNLIATDINPLAYGLYDREMFNASYIVPRATDPDYWPQIEQLIHDHDIDIAVIQPELEVVEWSKRQAAGSLPCKALIPDHDLAKVLVDKSLTTDLLRELDLVPQSVTFKADEENLQHIFDTLGNNFWVRSTCGTSGLGSLQVDSLKSLKNWIQINPDVHTFIASAYLPGRNLACKMLYYNGKLIRSACAERVNYIMAKVAPSGITGNTAFGRLINEPALTMRMVQAMDHLFKKTGTTQHGFFTADFKEDAGGKPYITEINVRHVAFTQCFAAGGANFAEDTIWLLDGDDSFDQSYQNYEFEKDLIFLRDVDNKPIMMKESDLYSLKALKKVRKPRLPVELEKA